MNPHSDTPSTITVRPATEAELPDLAAVELAADSVFAAIGIHLPPDTASVEDLRAAEFVLVAALEPQGPPVGYAMVEVIDGLAHLGQLSVHPDAARRGVGSALLAAAVEGSAARGFAALTLSTFADVVWNGPFYRSRGFSTFEQIGPELRRHLDDLTWLAEFGRREVLVRWLEGTQDPSTHRQNGWPAGSV